LATKQEVKKHTSAIHTSGSLSLLERKASNVLLFNAYDELLIEKHHTIPVAILAEICGYDSKDTAGLKNAIRNLVSTTVEWDILDDEGNEEEWGISSLLASVRFLKGGICRYEYTDTLAEKLKEPEIYGNINLQMQKQLVSSYTLVIYEMCSLVKGLIRKTKPAYTKWMTLETFRMLLGVKDSDYYQEFKHLNNKILKPSINEINGSIKRFAGTDIFIVPEYKKVGRAITDIRFIVDLNPQGSLPLEKDENAEIRKTPMYTKLIDRGLTDKGALHAILSNDSEYLEEKILIVDEAEEQGKIKSSVSGYLKRAIEDDYQPSKAKSKAKQESDNEALKAEQEAKEAEAKAEKDSRTKRDITLEMREQYIATLSENEQAELFEKLKSEAPAIMKKMVKDLTHPSFADAINKLIPDFENELSKRFSQSS